MLIINNQSIQALKWSGSMTISSKSWLSATAQSVSPHCWGDSPMISSSKVILRLLELTSDSSRSLSKAMLSSCKYGILPGNKDLERLRVHITKEHRPSLLCMISLKRRALRIWMHFGWERYEINVCRLRSMRYLMCMCWLLAIKLIIRSTGKYRRVWRKNFAEPKG